MEPIGQLLTSCRVPAPVYSDRGRRPPEDDCYCHDIDWRMTLAGGHSAANRSGCAGEVKANRGAADRTGYKRLARLMRAINPDLPGWIAE